MADFAFTRVRGDTIEYDITLSLNGAPLKPSTLTALTFTARRNPQDASPVFQKSLDSGIAIVDDNTGQVRVTIDPADTSSLTAPLMILYCTVKSVESSGRVTTLLEGTLSITL